MQKNTSESESCGVEHEGWNYYYFLLLIYEEKVIPIESMRDQIMENVIGMPGRSNYLFITAFYKKMNISETEICSVVLGNYIVKIPL